MFAFALLVRKLARVKYHIYCHNDCKSLNMRYRFIRTNYYAFAVTAVPVLALVSCGLFAQTIQLSKIELREFGPQPIQIDLHMWLDFSKNANISFTPVHTTKQPLVLNPSNVDRADVNRQSVNAGKVTIWVSPTGTRFLNRDRGVSYFAETLTSRVVRQQTIVYDPNRSTVWLYGEALYRYRIGTNELERIQPSSGTQVMFRKLVVTHAGVWLATDDGAYLFNNADETLRRVVQTERLSLINATAIGKTIWFADEQTRLIKFDTSIPNRITFAVSSKLPFGAPAEMLNANNGLWMGKAHDRAAIRNGKSRRVCLPRQCSNANVARIGRIVALSCK